MTKLDLGCGPNKKEGFIGIDQYEMKGVDHVLDLSKERLPFDDGTVDEIHSSHFFEHLTPQGRCHVANEMYRVMKPGAKAFIIVPHWASCRAYGDPTHQWPPLSEFWSLYLDRKWRMGDETAKPPLMANAPHTDKQFLSWGYDCDFEQVSAPAGMHPICAGRSQEWLQFAVSAYKEVITDMQVTLTRR